jgi:transposase
MRGAKEILPDELWRVVRPLLPPQKPERRPRLGRPRLDDRRALTGILYILKTGTSWHRLPPRLGCGSGRTCWRRVKEWRKAGIWDAVTRALKDRERSGAAIDWSRAGRPR